MLDDREIAETIQRLTDIERNTIYETFEKESDHILLEDLRDDHHYGSDNFNGKPDV